VRLAPLGIPARPAEHVPASDVEIAPLARRTFIPRDQQPDDLAREVASAVYDRQSAAAQVLPWSTTSGKAPQRRTLTEAQLTAETNALHPTTAMLLRQMGGDYGSCPWEIVEMQNGRMVDEQAKPVDKPWVERALAQLHNERDDEGAMKERLWWLWHVHGEAYVAVTDNLLPDGESPLGTFLCAVDAPEAARDGGQRGFGGEWYLKLPWGDGPDEWMPVFPEVASDGSVRLPVRRVVSSYGKTPGRPFTILQALAPFYQLFWTLVRGDLATADSRAIMNGLLWTPSGPMGTTLAGGAANAEAAAIYNMMGLTNSASDPDGLLASIARQSLNVWKYPGRHLSKLPIPVSTSVKPEFVEIARRFTQNDAMKLEAVELRMARGWEVPASIFLGSIGEARQNQFNAWRQEDEYIGAVKRPARQLDRVLTRAALWPLLTRFGVPYPQRYALRSDLTHIRPQRDTPENWMWAARNLGVKREAVMSGLGLPADDLLDGEAYREWIRVLGPTAQRQNSTTTGTGTPDSHASESQAAGNDATSTDSQGQATPSAQHDLLVALPPTDFTRRESAAVRYTPADLETRIASWVLATARDTNGLVGAVWDRTIERGSAMASDGVVDVELLARRVVGEMRASASRLIRTGFQRAYRIGGERAASVQASIESWLGLAGSELWDTGAETVASLVASAAALVGDAARWDRTAVTGPAYRLTRVALAAAYGQYVAASVVADAVLSSFGLEAWGWEWVYGDALRDSFQAHTELDGRTFPSWDDPVLATQPRDAWLQREFYAIDDHAGCECHAVRVVDER